MDTKSVISILLTIGVHFRYIWYICLLGTFSLVKIPLPTLVLLPMIQEFTLTPTSLQISWRGARSKGRYRLKWFQDDHCLGFCPFILWNITSTFFYKTVFFLTHLLWLIFWNHFRISVCYGRRQRIVTSGVN